MRNPHFDTGWISFSLFNNVKYYDSEEIRITDKKAGVGSFLYFSIVFPLVKFLCTFIF